MKYSKTALLVIAIYLLFTGLIVAQEQEPTIFLEASEKCNNYARHYCLNGSHEAAVNRALLDMKKKGYRITPKIIRNIARNTPSRSRNPLAVTVQ